jgi:hypothetical protein
MILSKKHCAGIFSVVLALGLVSGFAQGADSETDPNFNRARERAAMMAHLENPPVQALSIVNIPRDPEAATFLNFFKTLEGICSERLLVSAEVKTFSFLQELQIFLTSL